MPRVQRIPTEPDENYIPWRRSSMCHNRSPAPARRQDFQRILFSKNVQNVKSSPIKSPKKRQNFKLEPIGTSQAPKLN